MTAASKGDRVGPWTKYQAPPIPAGYRVVQQPAPADAFAAFPDAPAPSPAPATGPWTRYAPAGAGGNVFDQFDAPAAGKPAGNVFHQFDAPPGSSSGAPALPPGFKIVEYEGQRVEFPDDFSDDEIANALGTLSAQLSTTPAAQPQISTAKDVAESAASGLPRGLAETIMFPVTLSRMVEGAGNYLYNKAENGVRYAIGAEPLSEEELVRRAQPMNGVNSMLYDAQDKVRDKMDDVLHTPQTTPGRFAGAIAEFAAPGGLPGKAARTVPTALSKLARYGEDALGNVVAPAVTSEAAGEMADGTPYEGMMRFLGALVGNAGTAGVRAQNAPEAVIRRATDGMTDADWQAAQTLQNNGTGIRLSGPEAVAQARNGASRLPDILRVVEGSTAGGNVTAPFFARRPEQVDNAVSGVLDQIAPQNSNPYTLGPQAADAANAVIDQTRQGINAQTRSLYDAAQTQIIPDAQFAPIAADPRFTAAVQRLRNNPEIAPDYANLPDNSIGVIDAVTKDMAARGEALSNSANPLYGPELAARQRTGAVDARAIATTQSPEYAQALATQEQLRRTQLNPLEHGPVGRLASASDTATAADAVLPQNPLAGSASETADAVARLAGQDPEIAAALVRQNLSDRYSKAQTETQGGSRETAGAKFHQSVAGNDQRAEVLDAVLRALPGGAQTADQMGEMLDVLQGTMRRRPPGSPTEFNRQISDSLGDGSLLSALTRPDLIPRRLAGLVTNAGDAVRRVALGRNVRTLADLFVDPRSVDLIRDMANRRPGNAYGDAAARTAWEAGQTLSAPR
ncbi:hypothetical protein [Mesorhizobium sp. B2-3-4]|uniref:hypothetical protein n=1 Tax=Mesorhizobium sp. B2-3-4 TaxID=2589959 RepID=UPI00112D0652|nr:hypothetical protein [Mesorhizobium sp. B2-3-4]TPM31462.1 hypothetical protein FJ967_24795 [Mesorhizobium sp. B2-3-4]